MFSLRLLCGNQETLSALPDLSEFLAARILINTDKGLTPGRKGTKNLNYTDSKVLNYSRFITKVNTMS